VRDAVTSGRGWCKREFEGTEVDRPVPWLLHVGLAPDRASGSWMIPMFAANIYGSGLPVVAGGGANYITAFTALLAEREVAIDTGAGVTRFDV